jgi:hypothetical protein
MGNNGIMVREILQEYKVTRNKLRNSLSKSLSKVIVSKAEIKFIVRIILTREEDVVSTQEKQHLKFLLELNEITLEELKRLVYDTIVNLMNNDINDREMLIVHSFLIRNF